MSFFVILGGIYVARFCTNCGKEAKEYHKVCVYCGTKLKPIEQAEQTSTINDVTNEEKKRTNEKATAPDTNKKSPSEDKNETSSKKRLILPITGGAIAIILVILFMWAKSYQSPNNVLQRFEKALYDEDAKRISSLMIHEDASDVSVAEAEAFIDLYHELDEPINYRPIRDEKFLLFFDAYKIITEDQYAYYNHFAEGLAFLFNETEIDIFDQSDSTVTYGPMLPGKYTVEATYDGDYGSSKVTEEVILYDAYEQNPYIDVDLQLAHVVVAVENFNFIDTKKTFISIGEEEIPIDDHGESDSFGPIVLDGEQEAKIVSEMPWGKVSSDPIPLTDEYVTAYANIISNDHFKDISETITTFSEQFLKSLAEKSTKPLEVGSSQLKKDVTNYIDDYSYYTGQVEKVELDKANIFYDYEENDSLIYIPVRIETYEDYHAIDESPSLQDAEWYFDIGFKYGDDKWTIHSLANFSGWDFAGTDTFDGAKKMYGPSKEAIENAISREFEEEMTDFIFDYTEASVDAINFRDFSLMEDYVTKDGPRWKEAKDYIDYLDSKDIYEEWYGSSIEKIEDSGDKTWKVTMIEEFEIIRPDDWEVKKFRTAVVVKEIDGNFYVDELISTTQID